MTTSCIETRPKSWDMRTVLSVSTVLGVIGVVSAFGLFYLGERVFHLDRAHVQFLMYLKTIGGGTSHDIPDAHARTGLVNTSGAHIVDRCSRHAGACHAGRRLRRLHHDAAGLGLGAVHLGLRTRVVPPE